MGTVIYEAGPFQAFLGSFEGILVFVLLGLFGIGAAVLRRNQRPPARLVIGGLGALLLIIGCVFALFTLGSMLGGTRTITLQLNDKTIAQQSCGDEGETCPHYILSATTSANAYDFDVPEQAYDKARVKVCYQITYYQNKGLFSTPSSYQQIDSVSRIETADPSACQ